MLTLDGKILIVSDLHGRASSLKLLKKLLNDEKPDALLILGDFFAYGPRNGRPLDYDPWSLQKFLSSLSLPSYGVKGNCDDEDEAVMIDYAPYRSFYYQNKRFLMFHGDPLSLERIKDFRADVYLFGHTHFATLKRMNGFYYLNPGSLGYPKGGLPPSYGLLDKETIYLKNAENNEVWTTFSF